MDNGIFQDGLLIDVDVRFWSGAKALTAEDLGLKEESVVDAFNLGKKMLIPRDVIRSFKAVESQARRVVQDNSFSFPVGSARFVPKRKFEAVVAKLESCQAKYGALTEKLVENYEKYRTEMLPVYKQAAENAYLMQSPVTMEFSIEDREKDKDEFVQKFLDRIEKFYPTAQSLLERFSLNWTPYALAIPKMQKIEKEKALAEIAAEAFNKDKRNVAMATYQQAIREKVGSFVDDVVKELRGKVLEFCTKVSKNIEDGKVVTKRTVNGITEFIDKFSDLNFVGDKCVEEQLNELRDKFLNIYPPENIGDSDELKAELRRRIQVIMMAASEQTDVNSISGEYRRKIDWQTA